MPLVQIVHGLVCLNLLCMCPCMRAETALARVNAFSLLQNFQINAMGPILVSKEFAPLLSRAATVGGASRFPHGTPPSLQAKEQMCCAWPPCWVL